MPSEAGTAVPLLHDCNPLFHLHSFLNRNENHGYRAMLLCHLVNVILVKRMPHFAFDGEVRLISGFRLIGEKKLICNSEFLRILADDRFLDFVCFLNR